MYPVFSIDIPYIYIYPIYKHKMKYQDLIILYIPLYIPYVYIYIHNNMLTPPKIRISQFVVLVEKWWLVAPITYSIIYYTFHYILHIYHNNIYIYNRIDLFPYIPYIIYSSIYISIYIYMSRRQNQLFMPGTKI